MKKIASLILILMLIGNIGAYAQIDNPGFEGGIHKNEQDYKKKKEYKEVIFITGEPILLEGTVEISIKDKKIEYEYQLSTQDKNILLDREVEFDRVIEKNVYNNQQVEANNITDFDEDIIDKRE